LFEPGDVDMGADRASDIALFVEKRRGVNHQIQYLTVCQLDIEFHFTHLFTGHRSKLPRANLTNT